MIPRNRTSTAVYMLTRTLDIATRIAKMQHIEEHDTVWIAANFRQYIRGKDGTLYCCGEFTQRSDEREIRRYAESLGWKLEYGIPPSREYIV